MGRAHRPGQLELAVVDVDRDDPRRPGEGRAGDRGHPHAAAADHGDGRAAADVAGVDRRAQPGHHAAAEQPDGRGPGGGVDLGALPGGDEGLLREGADAEGRRELRAVLEGHLLGRVVGREAVPRLAAVARPALAADRAPVEHHEVAGLQPRHVRADRLDDARRLVAEQEGEVVVDPALAVVQVGVAHAAGLHRDDRLARTGVGDVDRDHLDRRALGECDHGLDLLHAMSPATSGASVCHEPPKQMQPPSTRSRPHPDTPRRGASDQTGGGG